MITVVDSITNMIDQVASDTYLAEGLKRKKQSFLCYIFAKMYFIKLDKDSFTYILNQLIQKEYYPLKVNKLKYPQRIKAYLLNQRLFLKVLYSPKVLQLKLKTNYK